ncbi:YggS family pyridoxal phosphate-dependent enzyme [Corynebacterium aquatimens]|uniref:Pyridoxal phosphate homeostasis protein n=1 Tax=Corynebacterium aquatimens TaxID=1190508 RepID=A0A931E0C5_9CORY|nr:YggS family pyridoxal phosphate-dependent enzyme [Corynebacterium aquatimens]MBG6121958.1 pyridoxal phosphate enzyme (YggS family) [Corynebacterium aquatimens]WJY65503.1 hypothetical protein CAQUA_03950 [Corynebacterium aquatimens]
MALDIDPARREEIARNLDAVRKKLHEAEASAGRAPGSVELLPVTKFHAVEDIAILGELGVTLVGENREQEARDKAETLRGAEAPAHPAGIAMLGQIQSKKANSVARWAAEVHSVDSVKLASGLDRGMALALERGDRTGTVLPCFIQFSFDGDPQRGGVERAGIDELADAIASAEHLQLAGIMVVPPLGADAEEVFSVSREITDVLSEKYCSADTESDTVKEPGTMGSKLRLSAGMSQDFPLAIECGSDIVRVGTALLGARPVR